MSDGIFRVDDGSVWHFDANDHAHARKLWAEALPGLGMGDSDTWVKDEGEPEITRVQLVDAAKIMLTLEDERDPCDKCGTPDMQQASRSLLDVWRDEQSLPEEKRAKYGALCNSEWP